MENELSGPVSFLEIVKCFSIAEAPKATEAIAAVFPSMIRQPTSTEYLFAKKTIFFKFASSNGAG